MDMPSHPETTDEQDPPEDVKKVKWGVVLSVAIPTAIVVVIVLLHLTGVVGPAAN